MTTLNTIIEEENTPDTEWEKEKWVEQIVEDVLLFEGSAYEISHKDVVKSERDRLREIVLAELRSDIELTIFQLLTSRDTYWKEREAEAYKKGYVDGELAYAQRIAMHFTPTPITNEDNLK